MIIYHWENYELEGNGMTFIKFRNKIKTHNIHLNILKIIFKNKDEIKMLYNSYPSNLL